jgi:16S rRNA (guanine527-N7)-methyltransferase
VNVKLFDLYAQELIHWNEKCNLTAITDLQEIKIKHFEDSLTILQAVPLTNQTVVDIGTGAGFPGIPLKITCPGIKLTLIEATRKKTEFLKHVVSVLKLEEVNVLWGRAEELCKNPLYHDKFDVALARAVTRLDRLVDFCLPFLHPGGTFIAQKGPSVDEEIKLAQKALSAAGGKIQAIQNFSLSNGDPRTLVVITKTP